MTSTLLCSRWVLPKQSRPLLGRFRGLFHHSSSHIAPALSSQLRLSSTSTRPEARKSWVQRLPPQIQPYLYLMRIDKPIGTLLLFYPCGQPFFSKNQFL